MWLAALGALAIGLSLGLLGSGGSILTVPILVYLVGQPEKLAIAGSLAIVGAVALAGALPWAARGQVDGRSIAWFGLPGMVGALAGSWFAQFLPGSLQLTIFSGVMLLAATRMARAAPAQAPAPASRERLVIQGLAVGALTGIVGIGGGFLILPALVLLGGLSMHRAIGTSLAIIALNASTGFAKHAYTLAQSGQALDWQVIGLFTAIGAAGSLAGQRLAGRLPQQTLRRAFALLLVVMGLYILWRSVPSLLALSI
jgi:uncharacterized membrane protein YfcA